MHVCGEWVGTVQPVPLQSVVLGPYCSPPQPAAAWRPVYTHTHTRTHTHTHTQSRFHITSPTHPCLGVPTSAQPTLVWLSRSCCSSRTKVACAVLNLLSTSCSTRSLVPWRAPSSSADSLDSYKEWGEQRGQRRTVLPLVDVCRRSQLCI